MITQQDAECAFHLNKLSLYLNQHYPVTFHACSGSLWAACQLAADRINQQNTEAEEHLFDLTWHDSNTLLAGNGSSPPFGKLNISCLNISIFFEWTEGGWWLERQYGLSLLLHSIPSTFGPVLIYISQGKPFVLFLGNHSLPLSSPPL